MQQDSTGKRGGVSEEGSGPHECRVARQGQVTRALWAQGFVQSGKHRVAHSGLHFEEKTGCCCESAWRGASGEKEASCAAGLGGDATRRGRTRSGDSRSTLIYFGG